MSGEWDEAAAAYHTIVEASDLSAADVQQLALREGQLRLALDEHDRAVEVLWRHCCRTPRRATSRPSPTTT